MIRDEIIKVIKKNSGIKQVHLETPENKSFGDYATNIALIRAQKEKKNPVEIAGRVVDKLRKGKRLAKIVSRIEVAGPGFINFYISEDALFKNLQEIAKKEAKYGRSTNLKGKKIMVEYAHPNTHKPFHIGHLRNIISGESIARILAATGAKVYSVNYQGDVGLHIAKAIWGVKKMGFTDPRNINKRMEFLGKAYVAGNKAFEEEKKAKEEITDINHKLYNQSDAELSRIYHTTRKWSLDYFERIYKRVDTKFDRLYFESEVADAGITIANYALKKGILEKSKGAVIYPGEKKGLHNRVFITGKGLATYEAKDLALAKLQLKEYSPDLILHIVGSEQKGYFEVVFKALGEIEKKLKEKEMHVVYGWVRLKDGKMSSRVGNVILGDWLIDEAKKRIIKKYEISNKIAEQIAIGAVKYSFLKIGLTSELVFDFDESISLEGNSGPYLQYTYARTKSVLRKVKNIEQRTQNKGAKYNAEELLVMRILARYSEVIIDAGKNYSPNLLCNYLFDLAQKYNHFYNSHNIIGSENEKFRLALTKGTGQVLKNGLTLLGIQAPERM